MGRQTSGVDPRTHFVCRREQQRMDFIISQDSRTIESHPYHFGSDILRALEVVESFEAKMRPSAIEHAFTPSQVGFWLDHIEQTFKLPFPEPGTLAAVLVVVCVGEGLDVNSEALFRLARRIRWMPQWEAYDALMKRADEEETSYDAGKERLLAEAVLLALGERDRPHRLLGKRWEGWVDAEGHRLVVRPQDLARPLRKLHRLWRWLAG